MVDSVLAGQIYLRLANADDAGQIKELIFQLARFEKLESECRVTEEKLLETVFDDPSRPPFKGPTVMLLEVGSTPGAATGEADEVIQYQRPPGGAPLEATGSGVERDATTVTDPEKQSFISRANPERVVAAFALVFPNYSTFLARPGIYVEDLYVREPYRRLGFGTMLLRFLARAAESRQMGRLEWSVLDWNERAIAFYTQRMGAQLMEEWRICRLTGAALEAAAKADVSP